MATRFMSKAILGTALGIALSPLLAAMPAAGPAPSNTEEALQLDLPAAPSNCRTGRFRVRNNQGDDYIFYYVSWRDNSNNEDGFTVETWWQSDSGVWVLGRSEDRAANYTSIGIGESRPGSRIRFRVKAFNASGDSAWSNWAR
jgi:hypothetical protein